MRVTREETNLAYLSGASDTKIWQYVRVFVAICLQKISDTMKSLWAYSIALFASTNQSASYLDVRVRYFHNNDIENYHIIALPMFNRHTGQYMFKTIAELLDMLDNN